MACLLPLVALQLVLLFLACSTLSSYPCVATAAPWKVVTSLPGFDGPLPFTLETGYAAVDVENSAELFYYFVESEGDSSQDPLILWFSGGNRCSVLSGLAFEMGPFKFVEEPYDGGVPRIEYNPYTWTKVASILFVDSPVGAGFSFSRNPRGYDVGSEDIPATERLKKFITQWLVEHPEYISNPFYVGGDSMAGRIVPYIAQKISEDIESGIEPHPNLQGYLVGNPVTEEIIDNNSRVPFAHGHGIISDQIYQRIMRHCQGEDYSHPKRAKCAESLDAFNYILEHEISMLHVLYPRCIYASPLKPNNGTATNRNVLIEEIRSLHNPPPRPPINCVSYKSYLSYYWANNDATTEALGIKKGSIGEWVRCHAPGLRSTSDQDIKSSIKYHLNVTSKGYRSLVYRWVRSLNFSIADDWRAWHLDGQSAGFTISYANNMTFATIKGAGHTPPEYEPERCFAMFQRWISARPL